MKAVKKLELGTRLLLVFFAAVFLLSVCHFFVYAKLLSNLEKEEKTINAERMNTAAVKLDFVFADIKNSYIQMLGKPCFKYLGSGVPEPYTLVEMHQEAAGTLGSCQYIAGYLVMFNSTDSVVNDMGCNSAQRYFDRYYKNDAYSLDLWQSGFLDSFFSMYYPAEEFTLQNSIGDTYDKTLMPLMLKSYWDNNIVTILLLQVDNIFVQDDAYLQEGLYVFSEEGTLLCTSDAQRQLTHLPEGDTVTLEDGTKCAVVSQVGENGMIYVKILPQTGNIGLLQTSFIFCLAVAVVSLCAVGVLLLSTIRWTLRPVNSMLSLLHQHGQLQNPNDLHGANTELEQILKNRDAQAAELAQKDAALSEYFLRSRLKNVYVNMEQPELMQEGSAYILYIQVQYRDSMRGYFSMTRAELENCLQEMLSGTLNQLFDTTLIFQMEPGRFAAKVTLSLGDGDIQDRMVRFMKRLENEKDFACFTVIQSQGLTREADLAAVYTQVQEAARHTKVVEDRSQLVTLPVSEEADTGYILTRQDEQKLMKLVCNGLTEDAAQLVRRILMENMEKGITHAQMEILCVTLVNKAAFAITELEPSAEKIAASSGVYNTLTTRCTTAKDYYEAVVGFIGSATATNNVHPAEDDQLLRKVQQYMKDNYQREFSGEEMAAALWVSRSYLSTYYKNKTGMNLSDSIQLYRIQQAVELLKNPDVRIGDVGLRVGIPSSNTFLRQFKKYTGMTPKEYRMKARQ